MFPDASQFLVSGLVIQSRWDSWAARLFLFKNWHAPFITGDGGTALTCSGSFASVFVSTP